MQMLKGDTKLMRKMWSVALSLVLLLQILPTAWATGDVVVAMRVGTPWCVIGGELVLLDSSSRSVMPILEQGRTLVPIRRVMEAFGGQVEWSAAEQRAICSLDGKRVEVKLGAAQALVDGTEVVLDVPAKIVEGRTFIPLRFVSENLGLQVGYDSNTGVTVISRTSYDEAALAVLPEVKSLHQRTANTGDPVTLKSGSYALPSGMVSANIITVDMNDLRVSVRMEMVDKTLNHTRPFKEILAGSQAVAAINGNFFESYADIKDPIGHVMGAGTFLYGNSGLSSMGVTMDNQMRWGRPPVFTRIKIIDGAAQEWSAYSVNTLEQFNDGSVLYTPTRGDSVPAKINGFVMTVEAGIISGYHPVKAGVLLSIPKNGFAFFMGTEFTTTSYFQTPVIGQNIVLEPYLRTDDTEGFLLNGVSEMISGAPRLVRDGAIESYLDPGFTEARFTTAVTSRTAIGTTKEGTMVLVNVPKASIQQMRELMLQLGCINAVNLDGGASTGMYYRGNFVATPGRALTTTLQVFVDR